MNTKSKLLLAFLGLFFLSSIVVGLVMSQSNSDMLDKLGNAVTIDGQDENGTANNSTTQPPVNSTDQIANLTEEQVTEIANNSEIVQEFFQKIDKFELIVFYSQEEDCWYVQYYSTQNWASYVFVVIDDNTGEIIYSESYIYSDEANLSEEQVMAIAMNSSDVQEFIHNYPNYYYSVWFDGFNYWYVEFYNMETYYSWCDVVIDDDTGLIVGIYKSGDVFQTNLNETEVLNIALNDPDVQLFIQNNPDYEVYIYFSGFCDIMETSEGNLNDSENALWEVDFWSTNYSDWISLLINDSTGLIIDKWMPNSAHLTNDEVMSIVNAIPEVVNFTTVYPDYQVSIYYDGIGYWYVRLYSTTFLDAYVDILIDDNTGEIISLTSYFPSAPLHSIDQVEKFVLAIDDVENYIANFTDDYEIDIYFEDTCWYVFVYSPSADYGIYIEINDNGVNGNLEVLFLTTYYCFDNSSK